MHRYLWLLLSALPSLGAAQEGTIPSRILGEYVRVHEVRDYCRDTEAKCPLVKVKDSVVISRQKNSSVSVTISTLGHDLHTCEFQGVGKWDKSALKVQGYQPNDSCGLLLSFSTPNEIKITGAKGGACEMLCGANASLYIEGLKKVVAK